MFVSVIVPSYNHAQYLEQRIESILKQSYSEFEIILLDDLSPDNSAEILEKYKNHPKVSHCIINEKNSGSTFYQWNKGISLAKGDLIWIAESDDVADPTFLEKLVPAFINNPNLVLAYSQSYRMNAQGEVTGSWKDCTDNIDSELFQNGFKLSGIEYFKKFLNNRNTIPNASAVVFKKQTYLDVGEANPSLRFNGDWEIWAKISLQGEIFFIHECLNYFRYHDTSVIAQAKIKKDHFETRYHAILFRENIADFLKNSNNPELKVIENENFKKLQTEKRKNASLAIRKRYYNKIVPTSLIALKTEPLAFAPILVIKLIAQFLLSMLIIFPLKSIQNLFR